MTQLTLSLAQMPVRPGAAAQNLAVVQAMAAEAAGRGTDLLLLPELWGTGYDLAHAEAHARKADAQGFEEMAGLARAYRMWVGGSLLGWPGEVVGRPHNLFALFAPDGTRTHVYAKLHLFRLMNEEQWLAPGAGPTLAALPWGAVGMAICYDLRFPELFRDYALAGARLLILPAQWPHPRLAHWQTLLRARAIENQIFVAACNRVGEDPNGTRFFGHSTLLDPWGETIAEAGEEPTLLTATIDLAQVDEVRRKIPVFEDRRVDVYGGVTSEE